MPTRSARSWSARTRERTLIVGAGRSGRSLLRELRESPGVRVVGFVDDDPEFRRRRIQGVPVVANLEEIGWAIGRLSPEAVLVTIPDADRIRLELVIEACKRADISCRFVRRHMDIDPAVAFGRRRRVTAVATPQRVEQTRPRPRRTITDRLLAAVPLASIYLWLCIVYGFEAWRHVTPWLFTDELETTQISRSIAATGHAARRGQPYHLHSLYPVMLAPVWLIHDVATAYSGIKYLDVFVMTSAIFPTYFLARLVVRRGWALFAAAGAAVIPSLAYSSWIVEETLAYPYAALCFFLIAKALIERRRGWVTGAIVASLVAPFVRGELVVIPIVFIFASLFALWTSDWGRSRRASWSWGDYLGVFVLAAGAIFIDQRGPRATTRSSGTA